MPNYNNVNSLTIRRLLEVAHEVLQVLVLKHSTSKKTRHAPKHAVFGRILVGWARFSFRCPPSTHYRVFDRFNMV